MSGSTAGPGAIANDGGRGTGDDRTAEELITFLRSEGAARLGHAGERTLLDHLVGTYEIVRRWNQPPRLQHAALIHSVYGTDVYGQQLLPPSRRDDVVRIAGDEAERLAYLFCVTPRDLLFAGTHLWAADLSTLPPVRVRETSDRPPATEVELDELVLLHMANLAEQARADDGSPGLWLVRLRELAELLVGRESVTIPLFVAELAAFSDTDESLARRAYQAGTAPVDDLPGEGEPSSVGGRRVSGGGRTVHLVGAPFALPGRRVGGAVVGRMRSSTISRARHGMGQASDIRGMARGRTPTRKGNGS